MALCIPGTTNEKPLFRSGNQHLRLGITARTDNPVPGINPAL